MNAPLTPKGNAQIRQESAAWFAEFSEGDVSAEVREAFARWLKTSPEHVRAYLQVSATFNDVGRLGKHQAAERQALIERARSESNVVSLPGALADIDLAKPLATGVAGRTSRTSRMRWVAGVALAASVIVGVLLTQQRGVYGTGTGEQRLVTLADGSIIELNAQSRVRVRLNEQQRSVDLLDGQAVFIVAKDKTRPFIVRSDSTRVEAVGTQFDVNRLAADTVVTVLEGRVSVTASERGVKPILASAGEQVIHSGHAATKPPHPDLAAATAWRQRRLVFVSSPLDHVVTEYNRYHKRRLLIADPALGSIRIDALLSATDSQSLIVFLRAQPNIEVDEQDDRIVLRAK